MEENQQNPTPMPASSNPRAARRKILQPSESFVAEMKAAQQDTTAPVAPQAKQPVQQTQAQPPVNPATRASSIYPDPTSGVGASEPPPSSDEPHSTNSSKVIAVRIVAGTLILLNLFNAYNVFTGLHSGATVWFNFIGIGLGILLAVGIFLLNEAARVTYVFLSVLMLVLSVIGFASFYMSTHNNPAFQASSQSLTKTQLENSLKAAENNTSLPAKARQEDIQQLQRQINSLSASPTEQKVKQYLTYGLLLVVAVGPLVFFTRPSIKQVFH